MLGVLLDVGLTDFDARWLKARTTVFAVDIYCFRRLEGRLLAVLRALI